jgi:choline dehydrogenase-like flavoprotein
MQDKSIPEHFDVVIVGSGPVGATLANLLGLCGVRTLVLEREARTYHLPRAVHFDDECMRVFQSIVLADSILPKVILSPGMLFLEAAAAKMNARAVALFESDSHESSLRAMLGDQKLTAAVGVDQYAPQSDYNSSGETRIAYGGRGTTQVFLIAADGSVADDQVRLEAVK